MRKRSPPPKPSEGAKRKKGKPKGKKEVFVATKNNIALQRVKKRDR